MKNTKGFTLIELLVVIAIIGVLVLLGLRTYGSQKERALNSIAKANAITIQTMLVGYMGDHDILTGNGKSDITDALGAEDQKILESMVNPYSSDATVYRIDTVVNSTFDDKDSAYQGNVSVLLVADNKLLVNARGQDGEVLFDAPYVLPANKD